MATRQADVARVPPAQQWSLDAVLATNGHLACSARVLQVVVEALRDQDQVGEAKVDCESDDGGDKTCPNCACEVGDVTDKPDNKKGKRNPVCRARLVVFYQLGHL